jgi:hypothetical protein
MHAFERNRPRVWGFRSKPQEPWPFFSFKRVDNLSFELFSLKNRQTKRRPPRQMKHYLLANGGRKIRAMGF